LFLGFSVFFICGEEMSGFGGGQMVWPAVGRGTAMGGGHGGLGGGQMV